MVKKTRLDVTGHHITARGVIIAATITAISAIIIALINVWVQSRSKPDPTPKPNLKLVGRVIDANTEAPVRNAKVRLEIQDVPAITYTDSEGTFSFPVDQNTSEVHIRVDAGGFEHFDRRILLSFKKEIEDIRLSPIKAARDPGPSKSKTPQRGSTNSKSQKEKALEKLHSPPPERNDSSSNRNSAQQTSE